MYLVANLQVVSPVAWVQKEKLLERIERSTLRDLSEGEDQELGTFGFINRECFRSA
jgi:hypothetical protein